MWFVVSLIVPGFLAFLGDSFLLAIPDDVGQEKRVSRVILLLQFVVKKGFPLGALHVFADLDDCRLLVPGVALLGVLVPLGVRTIDVLSEHLHAHLGLGVDEAATGLGLEPHKGLDGVAHALHANITCRRPAHRLGLDGHLVPCFQCAEPRQRLQFFQQKFHGLFNRNGLCLLVFQDVQDVPVNDCAGLVVYAAQGQVAQAHVNSYNMHLFPSLLFFSGNANA